jgi:hypothetical protein
MKVSLKRSIVCGTLRFVAAVVRTRAGPETCRRPLPDKRSGRSVLFPFQCRRGLARIHAFAAAAPERRAESSRNGTVDCRGGGIGWHRTGGAVIRCMFQRSTRVGAIESGPSELTTLAGKANGTARCRMNGVRSD